MVADPDRPWALGTCTPSLTLPPPPPTSSLDAAGGGLSCRVREWIDQSGVDPAVGWEVV